MKPCLMQSRSARFRPRDAQLVPWRRFFAGYPKYRALAFFLHNLCTCDGALATLGFSTLTNDFFSNAAYSRHKNDNQQKLCEGIKICQSVVCKSSPKTNQWKYAGFGSPLYSGFRSVYGGILQSAGILRNSVEISITMRTYQNRFR
jgi:hypothetical protein